MRGYLWFREFVYRKFHKTLSYYEADQLRKEWTDQGMRIPLETFAKDWLDRRQKHG